MTIEPNKYQQIRTCAGLFDASKPFGRVVARGKDVIDLLHRMSTNDLKPLEQTIPQAKLTVLTNEKGRFVDVLKVVREASGRILLLTSAGLEETVIRWLDKFTIMEDAHFELATAKIAQFLICGPKATSIVGRYAGLEAIEEPRTGAYELKIDDIPATLVKAPSLAGNAWFILTDADRASGPVG